MKKTVLATLGIWELNVKSSSKIQDTSKFICRKRPSCSCRHVEMMSSSDWLSGLHTPASLDFAAAFTADSYLAESQMVLFLSDIALQKELPIRKLGGCKVPILVTTLGHKLYEGNKISFCCCPLSDHLRSLFYKGLVPVSSPR